MTITIDPAAAAAAVDRMVAAAIVTAETATGEEMAAAGATDAADQWVPGAAASVRPWISAGRIQVASALAPIDRHSGAARPRDPAISRRQSRRKTKRRVITAAGAG